MAAVMRDDLDLLVQEAAPLLRRVDQVLSAGGAPPEHPVWVELRRVRLLPSAAVHAVAALRPQELVGASPELRADARAYADIAATLPSPAGWSGDAAEAYDAARRRAADHLSGEPDSLDERLEATADLADALVEWMRQARRETAAMLTGVLTSAEAVDLSSAAPLEPTSVRELAAAAALASRVLRTVADSYEPAADLLTGSATLTD